jgi:hypothetical protein
MRSDKFSVHFISPVAARAEKLDKAIKSMNINLLFLSILLKILCALLRVFASSREIKKFPANPQR